MAHILRLRLHAVCGSRLASSTACKLLTSPGPRLTSWRWYGDSALLEDHCNSSNEIDGGSMATIREDTLVKEPEGTKSGTLKRAPATLGVNSLKWEDPLESRLGKLSSLVSDQSGAKQNIAHEEKGDANQCKADHPSAEGSSKSAKDDKWQQLVSNMRTMAIKKKAKASGVDTVDSLKASLERQRSSAPTGGQQFSVSEEVSVSNREPLTTSVSGTNLKQKNYQSQSSNQQRNTQSQSSNQQKSKNLEPLDFDFLKALDLEDAMKEFENGYNDIQDNLSKSNPANPSDKFVDKTTSDDLKNWSSAMNSVDELFADQLETSKTTTLHLSSGVKSKDGGSQNKSPQSSKDSLLYPRGKDSSYSRAPQGNNVQDRSQQPKGRNDASNTVKDRIPSGTRKATPQPSSNGDVASQKVHMVCVQNLPPTCNPGSIRASMAIHGEVTGFFKKPLWGDKLNVYIQFKTAEGMEKALAARKLLVGNRTCFVTRADQAAFTSVVRISRVGPDTDESQLRAVCEKYGKVDDVKKRTHSVFDVFYDVMELGNIASIVTSLNDVKLNRHMWFALPAPVLHPSVQKEVLNSPEGHSWHDSQVNQALNRIETGLDMVWVLFEDLKELTVAAKEYSK